MMHLSLSKVHYEAMRGSTYVYSVLSMLPSGVSGRACHSENHAVWKMREASLGPHAYGDPYDMMIYAVTLLLSTHPRQKGQLAEKL